LYKKYLIADTFEVTLRPLQIDFIFTLCSEKTHLCFLLYLHGKCSDSHKIFSQCLGGNKYSTGGKVKYFLLLVMTCWRHIFTFVNYGFYHWRQTSDKMFASQQGLCSRKFVLHVSLQWTDNEILNE